MKYAELTQEKENTIMSFQNNRVGYEIKKKIYPQEQ